MEYRNLGRSGLKVSPLCLGTMMFGSWGNADGSDCARIVHRALDAGVNFIDTSNNYSNGEAERIVGKAIAGRREEVVLATKVFAPMGPGPNQRGLSRKAIQEQVEHSLERLGTDVIDLYQVHRPDRATPWEETLSTLTDLVRQGKVRYVGCSTSHVTDPGRGPWSLRLEAWEVVETLWIAERHGFERWTSIQPPYSLLRRSMETEHFPMARKVGLGTMVWSPLEGGWLAGKYRKGSANPSDTPRSRDWVGDLSNPKFSRRLDVVEALAPWAEKRGLTLAQLSLAWVLQNPDVTSVILGPRTLEQLEDALRAPEVTLTESDLTLVDALVPPGTSALD